MILIPINYLAVLSAAIISMVLGGLWYSPLLFGNIWMKEMNINKKKVEEMKKKGIVKSGMLKSYVLMFVGCLVTSCVLAHFVKYLQVNTFILALQLAIMVWLGFIVPMALSSVLWEGKSIKVYLINVGYTLVSLVIATLILGFWV